MIKVEKAGYSILITEGFRTLKRQAELYAQGRITPGKIVTNAQGMQSMHCRGKAFDIAFTGVNPYPNDDTKWKAIADIALSCGLTSGYYFKTFKDRPHIQL